MIRFDINLVQTGYPVFWVIFEPFYRDNMDSLPQFYDGNVAWLYEDGIKKGVEMNAFKDQFFRFFMEYGISIHEGEEYWQVTHNNKLHTIEIDHNGWLHLLTWLMEYVDGYQSDI